MFLSWVKERAENKEALDNSNIDRLSQRYLRGAFPIVQKCRVVRLIRRIIEEGVTVRGVVEMYEAGMKLLMEITKGGKKEGEEEEEEKIKLIGELCLLQSIGEEKKIKENEKEVLKRNLEDERRKRVENEIGREEERIMKEEEKKGREEEKKRADEEKRLKDEEKRKREESERGREEEKRKREKVEEENRQLKERVRRYEMEDQRRRKEEERRRREEEERRYRPVTSLDATSVIFTPNTERIKIEGNIIIHSSLMSFIWI